MTTPVKKSNVTVIGYKQAADTAGLVTNATDSYPPDTFTGSYTDAGAVAEVSIIEPTYKPGTLKSLTTTNNILGQCVEVMEVNIDGTGFTIELIEEGAKENEAEKKMLQDFFDEPYPNKSMISIRREIRDDIESTGNGYMECIRNMTGDLMMLNNLKSETMRLVRYDDAVFVDKTITRNGKEVTVKIRARERRYVQNINGKKVFFKEFGASRELDRDTGKWAEKGVQLSIAKRASEVLHFVMSSDAKTPYGVPRWINQLPSVLGSRKAEEFNLDFFDSGGLPPLMVVVQGGTLGDEMKTQLETHLSGKGAKHRAIVVEAISSSGSLDSSGTVKVAVERFGTERQQDSMFQQYDKNCEEHVRVAFRLPPLFIGRSGDYSFATAVTAYMTAEAQVFLPERIEFDERMWWLCRALGAKTYMFKSKPMTLTNVENQLKGIQMVVTGKNATNESIIEEVNALTGLHLEVAEPPPEPEKPPTLAHIDPLTNLPYTKPVDPLHPNDPRLLKATGGKAGDPPEPIPQVPPKEVKKVPTTKAEQITNLLVLADQWSNVLGLSGECTFSPDEVAIIKSEVTALQGDDQKSFNEILASKSLVNSRVDIEGLGELCGHVSNHWGE